MVSLVTFGETSLLLRPAGEQRLETATDVEMTVSGVESNVAVAASQQGADALWLSKLPDTPLGDRVERALHQHGIETEIAWAEKGRQSLHFTERDVRPREARSFEDRFHCATASVTPGELPMDRVQAADGVFVAGSTLALSEQLVGTAGAVLRAGGAGGATAMDLDYRPGLWSLDDARETYEELFGSVDVLFANESQAREVFDRSGKPPEMAHAIASQGGFDVVVITRSEMGALAVHDATIHEQDSVETDVVDTTGQHAAFVGGFLQRYLDGNDVGAALNYGVAAAALTRTVPGPMTTVSRKETEALVDQLESGR